MRSVIKRKCSIPSCDNHGTWRSGLCPTCRLYLKRAEARPVAWRVARQETISRWSERLERVGARPVLRVVKGGK
jgi:hypothetical protein